MLFRSRLGESEGVGVAEKAFLERSWIFGCWELGFEASGPGGGDWSHERGEGKGGKLARGKK